MLTVILATPLALVVAVALMIFSELGAPLWVARTDEELHRIGGRAPRAAGLTPTEERVAAQMNDPKVSQRRLDDPARPPNMSVIAGLLLGSPEFQKR